MPIVLIYTFDIDEDQIKCYDQSMQNAEYFTEFIYLKCVNIYSFPTFLIIILIEFSLIVTPL